MKDKNLSQVTSSVQVSYEKLCESDSKKSCADGCILNVVFKNEQYFKKYKLKLGQFLKELLEEGEQYAIEYVNEEFDESFQIDKKYESDDLETVPVYSKSYEDILHCPEPEVPKAIVENNKPQKMTCFNCLGDHHMKECPEKIDHQRVASNKKDLMAFNTSRYHEEERKNAFKPGFPSTELRNALGLKEYQLPRYIYHMRIIGYPPGWKEEAIHETSGLCLYDNLENSLENKSNSLSNQVQYDAEKFVKYPGFNLPVPNGFKDEWTQIPGGCPIQKHQQLSDMIKYSNTINNPIVYKRKQPMSTSTDDNKKSKNGTNNVIESSSCWSPEHSSTPKQNKHESKLNVTVPESPISQNNESFSISKSPGTPVVGHGNLFLRLPDANKFARDITEHLPFENLPDAVGKFENMRNVISNVQKKLKELNGS